MTNSSLYNERDGMLKRIPDHFGDTSYVLVGFEKQTGAVKFTVQGYDRTYEFDVDTVILQSFFKWLEGILTSPYNENHEFTFFETKRKKTLMVGYLPSNCNGSYHEADVDCDFPKIALAECGMYYVYDTEKDTVLESAFVRYEDLVRRIYSAIKLSSQALRTLTCTRA